MSTQDVKVRTLYLFFCIYVRIPDKNKLLLFNKFEVLLWTNSIEKCKICSFFKISNPFFHNLEKYWWHLRKLGPYKEGHRILIQKATNMTLWSTLMLKYQDLNSLTFSSNRFDHIFIADGQCDSPVGGTVTAAMETADRWIRVKVLSSIL